MALVLTVDDDAMILALLQHRLKREGHEALAYASAQEALDAMVLPSQTRIPDLAILDVMMPVKSGFQLCRELRARPGWEALPGDLPERSSSARGHRDRPGDGRHLPHQAFRRFGAREGDRRRDSTPRDFVIRERRAESR